MEYSSTMKIRLPGISTLLDDMSSSDETSYDSHEYREEVTPAKYDGFQRRFGYTESYAPEARQTNNHADKEYETPSKPPLSAKKSKGSAMKSGKSTGRKSAGNRSRRSTFSPTSANLNNVLHATAEAIVANSQPESLGERIVERLDDFAEGVFSFIGKGDGSRGCRETKCKEQVEAQQVRRNEATADIADLDDAKSEVDSQTEIDLATQSFTAEAGNTTVDDSATNQLSPEELTELNNNSADLNTSNESDESHFYIGLGEDGFCPSQSIHDSDISETDSEFDGLEDTFEEEFDETFDSELNETFDSHAERVEVDMSVLTEYVDQDVLEIGSSLAEMALNASILTEIVGEEKKGEPDQDAHPEAFEGLSDSIQDDIDAMGAYHRKLTHEAYHHAASRSSPISGHNLGISPKASVNDSLISGEDAFLSSSLKCYVNDQANNLKSLLSSINGLTATPGRIEGVVLRDMLEEDDSDDGKLGLTPLKSRLESVVLDDGRKRGCKLFSSPEEGVELNKTNKEDDHRGVMLFSSPLTESDFEKDEKETDHDAVLLQSPQNEQEFKKDANFSKQPQSEPRKAADASTDDLDLGKTADESGLVTATPATEKNSAETEDLNRGLLKSPNLEQVDSHAGESPLITETAPVNASPLEVAAAEFATRSSALLECLRESPTSQREDMCQTSNKDDSVSPSSQDQEEDEIPAAFREMFANAESVLQKELSSPYLGENIAINIDGMGTFCDDYVKPIKSSDFNPRESLAPPNNADRLFLSPTGCIPLDTANLNKTNALEAETTTINLDSLKEVFLKAESQLESAESSIHRELLPEADGPDEHSETDTTFDTANFSMSGLIAAADDFFDANEELVDAVEGEDASAVLTNMACKNSDTEPLPESNDNESQEDEAKSTYLSENSTSGADSDSNVDITTTLDRVGDYLKRMAVQEAVSDTNDNADSSFDADAEYPECTVPTLSVDTEVDAENSDQIDVPTPLASNITAESIGQSETVDQNMSLPENAELTVNSEVNNEKMPEESTAIIGGQSLHPDVLDISEESTTVMDQHADDTANCEVQETLNAHEQPTHSVEQSPDNRPKSADCTHVEGNASSLEASARSDDMDESMFMPNISMETSLIASPAPAVNNEPEQALQPTPEEDEDSGALSDEDFFPNRDLTKMPTSKASASTSFVEPVAPPVSKSDAKPLNVKDAEASRFSHSSPPRESAATLSHRARPNSRKTTAPKTPPSNVKPATKRTKLSTITNTADSPKRTTAAVKKPKPSAVEKKRVARVASKTSNIVASASTSASQPESRIAKAVPKRRETKQVVGVSPTSSIRRSLVAVARQSNIPKPKPQQRSSISRSDRLEQLAKPRTVVKKEITPNNVVAQKTVACAKPPSFLNRERKKSTVKSAEEREAEEMSSIKPFKATGIKGSSVKIKSRFNTPRGSTSKQRTQSDGKPFKSLREKIINYNFREAPTVTTPINPKKLSAPSFVQYELAKAPKQNVHTLGESINNYDFRSTPAATTPINPNAKPPSFLSRPSPAASHTLLKTSEELELEECKHKFKACPPPVSSVSRHRHASRPRDERCLTTPRPPKLHTSARKMTTPILTQDDIELRKQFHARPLPASVYGSSTPRRYYGNTPQPSADEVELRNKFHARPLPEEIYGKTVCNDTTPFHIRASEQHERAMERKKLMLVEEMEQLKRCRERKATPLPPTNWQARPIRIEKSSKELVQPRPPRLSLDARLRERQEFDDHVQQKKDEEAAAEAARREEEARTEEEELRRRRSLAIEEGGFCFRARPVSIKYE